ncbi:hypothetical protein CLAFUW4_12321 [Fulvia fulva]|uniref:ZZ-type domain-containing protein n=1 Tax=Passalora fulva TaxID=5499 RepID=A0A9Q8PDQ4_PASFU|nr:uncharacterized protein CLAFUR5_11351 [Fulvia fulva]KAK4618056.1 hypothetical protein CLAFUR4_12326 [Fulvia fulva]KAK4618890.1 hypothetical protein CLAFUR0_12337 [Fulvia fulva]UJO20569.1 hypothetical protein CLAFUR5_11351 [Fulvia fulva]WPV18273.1 hypothetical protein CLAFUW4_12321 [Fulvia fulva]WPV33646.1 hypothetical protein CLAFUW7_12328 [Fulvia fulva]
MADSPSPLPLPDTPGDVPGLTYVPYYLDPSPRLQSRSHIIQPSDHEASDSPDSTTTGLQKSIISRPIQTAAEDLPQARVLAAIDRWYDQFLEFSTSDKWSLSKCSMLDLTDTVQKGFYYMDTRVFREGFSVLRHVGDLAPKALCSEHPAAFIYALRGLGATRQKASRSSNVDPESNAWRPNILQVGQPRVLECNGCDDPIVEAHHHCTICYGGYYDLCADCVVAGKHCLNNDHWLIKRIIDDQGVVVESASEMLPPRFMRDDAHARLVTPSLHRRPVLKPRLLRVDEPMTRSAAFPKVCFYLLQQARELRGLNHPLSLLLEIFQRPADLETLRGHILAIMDVQLAARISSAGAASQILHLEAAREWVLYQQGKHQELETWVNSYLLKEITPQNGRRAHGIAGCS